MAYSDTSELCQKSVQSHAEAFSWTVTKTKTLKGSFAKLNRFQVESVIKTYLYAAH